MRPYYPVVVLLALLAACGSDQRANPVREALARTPRSSGVGASVTFRFPAQSAGDTKLYHLPGLEEVAWRFEGGEHPTAEPVGFASDDDLLYALTSQRELLTLDLSTGRARVVDSGVVLVTLGPTGVPHVVYDSGAVATIQRRTAVGWPEGFSAPPAAIWGAVRHRLLGVVPGDSGRTLELLSEGSAPVRQALPAGELAVSRWGDLVAVATDSGIVTLNPADTAGHEFMRLRPAPGLVVHSPSAHRIYAASTTELLAIERFDLDVLERMPLPGTVTALRIDPVGRLLLLRPASGDSVWLVDLARWRLVGAVPGQWDGNLPTVAPDGTVLVRHGEDVAAVEPESVTVTGTAHDSTGDRWLTAAWDPRRPALELVSDTTRLAAAVPSLTYWVQVSSTINQAWAQERASDLRRAGITATVLPPTLPDEPFRVVIGPHATREQAESIGRKLGLPYWIFMRDTSGVVP